MSIGFWFSFFFATHPNNAPCIEQGTPEGDPAEAPPAPDPKPEWVPDVLLEMPEPYTPDKTPDD